MKANGNSKRWKNPTHILAKFQGVHLTSVEERASDINGKKRSSHFVRFQSPITVASGLKK